MDVATPGGGRRSTKRALVIVCALVTATVLGGCGGQVPGAAQGSGEAQVSSGTQGPGGGQGQGPSATTDQAPSTADGTAAAPTTTDATNSSPPLRTETHPPPATERGGTEAPDTGSSTGVTVSLPGMPIGGSSSMNADEAGCAEVAYLGGEEHPIPDGATLVVTAVHFSSDLLEVGGNGCGSGRRNCSGSAGAFTDQERNCVLSVVATREPTSAPGQEDDGDASEEVVLGMDASVDCAPADEQRCQAFADGVEGQVAGQTASITVLASASPEPESPPGSSSQSAPASESSAPESEQSDDTSEPAASPSD
jgi:hypothetical protein